MESLRKQRKNAVCDKSKKGRKNTKRTKSTVLDERNSDIQVSCDEIKQLSVSTINEDQQRKNAVCDKSKKGRKKTKRTKSTVLDERNSDIQVSCDEIKQLSVSTINEDQQRTLQISSVGPSIVCMKKKLLILDLNGLLVDIVSPPPKWCKADKRIRGRAIFKRPFYLEFLNFCFEKFEVGVWSSRMKTNINSIIDYLMGNMKDRLLFCWDLSHCTKTKFKTLENKHKPLVFKDLRKIWEKHDSNLPWEKGYFNESNTLLLDDSPYKALLNPPYNSVFPHTFKFQNQNDNSLAAGGDLRQYLDGLANAENMHDYVKQHPFGQGGINKKSRRWDFYCKVIHSLSTHGSQNRAATRKIVQVCDSATAKRAHPTSESCASRDGRIVEQKIA